MPEHDLIGGDVWLRRLHLIGPPGPSNIGRMTDAISIVRSSKDFVELKPSAAVAIDLKYATPDNFIGEDVYKNFCHAFLHRFAFRKLEKAAEFLQRQKPQCKFLILDALRPRSVQRILWAKVKGTDEESYVADPDKGSMHNYGMAVDLTVIDEKGQWLDMGSGFDDFRELSQPILEEKFLQSGMLTAKHRENRLLLRHSMEAGGFLSIKTEWWHFNAMTLDEARKDFQIIE